MGYPMTFQRFINRNQLKDGDYAKVPSAMAGLFSGDLTFDTIKRLQTLEQKFRLIAGDLRRLEKDTVDENVPCKLIAEKTGVDQEVVAAVLKAFLEI